MIKIADFKKVELKIATVKAVADHPNADRLYVVTVDLGSEERQLVAGIKPHYRPEELVGKRVVVVTNMETAKLRGVESHGMLLAASSGGAVTVLTTDREAAPGSAVS